MVPRPIRTVLISTLFPSSVRPTHGIFVETRLRELLKSGEVQTEVIAPVPWFPFKSKIYGEYSSFARTPHLETRNGIRVHHPRYILPPKVGMNVAPHTLAHAILPIVRAIIGNGFDFDLIDAHYYYPDGVAAGMVAKVLRKPFVVTARGTDLNLIPEHAYPRRLILETARAASGSIGVCKALMDKLMQLGADPEKLHVFRNGVDLERFKPIDQNLAREKLNIPARRILLSVGHLIERKGHNLAIAALSNLPSNFILLIAGSGPDEKKLKTQVKNLRLSDRVRFLGQIPNDELKWLYSAADALILASSREGWANVLLESMACGTPVIASNIWGTPEVVSHPDAGQLMPDLSPNGILIALNRLFSNYPSRQNVRLHAEKFNWDETTQKQIRLFRLTESLN